MTEMAALGGHFGVVVTILLASRTRLHDFVSQVLSERELHDGLVFAAAALVVLPLVPDRPVGPYAVFNPFIVWRLVVIVMAISAFGTSRDGCLVPGKGFPWRAAPRGSRGRRVNPTMQPGPPWSLFQGVCDCPGTLGDVVPVAEVALWRAYRPHNGSLPEAQPVLFEPSGEQAVLTGAGQSSDLVDLHGVFLCGVRRVPERPVAEKPTVLAARASLCASTKRFAASIQFPR